MELYYKVIARATLTLANLREERGQTMTEYALLIALVAIVLIAVIGVLTGGISNIFNSAGSKLSNVTT
ncbi:MAG: Flp/Fap pilin component [Solirubrobacteraceae bacterium]|jgi:pilus assembly protein Flp/PilA|nr:Flp/Fap pilin component [Solirubrobacteraceae bacterium]